MPSPQTRKPYVSDSFYHIYNRGVGKMDIFRDERDYKVFLYYLKIILSPVESLEQHLNSLTQEFLSLTAQTGARPRGNAPHQDYLERKIKRIQRALHHAYHHRLYENVELLSYCLMPNHFHLFIYQKIQDGIAKLMQRLGIAFSSYFTHRHNYLGPLYQGVYRANHLRYNPPLQALFTGRYIERNSSTPTLSGARPRSKAPGQAIMEYPFSSLRFYRAANSGAATENPIWLNTARLTQIFQQAKQKPNSIFEEAIAGHKTYTDFVLAELDLSLEDLRLTYLQNL